MKSRQTLKAKTLGALIILGVLGAAVLLIPKGNTSSQPAASKTVPRFGLDEDAPTYADLAGAISAAPVVVLGTVTQETVEEGSSPGTDAEGEPLPAVPHTVYSVTVSQDFKGPATIGQVLQVVLIGGATEEADFILDGGPQLSVGQSGVYFLEEGPDGRYYPLSGGAAVATEQQAGQYVLPVQATGSEPVSFTESQVVSLVGGPSTGNSQQNQSAPAAGTKPRGLSVSLSLYPKQTLATIRKHGLRVAVHCSESCTTRGSALVNRATAQRIGLVKGHRAGPSAVVVGKGSSARTELKLTLKPRYLDSIGSNDKGAVSLMVRALDQSGASAKAAASVHLGVKQVVLAK